MFSSYASAILSILTKYQIQHVGVLAFQPDESTASYMALYNQFTATLLHLLESNHIELVARKTVYNNLNADSSTNAPCSVIARFLQKSCLKTRGNLTLSPYKHNCHCVLALKTSTK